MDSVDSWESHSIYGLLICREKNHIQPFIIVLERESLLILTRNEARPRRETKALSSSRSASAPLFAPLRAPIKAGHPPTRRIHQATTHKQTVFLSAISPPPLRRRLQGEGIHLPGSHGRQQQGGHPHVRRGGGVGGATAATAPADPVRAGGAAQGVGAGASVDGAGARAEAGGDLLPRRPPAPLQGPVPGQEADARAAVLLPDLRLGLPLQPPPPPLRRHRRPHHCQPRHPPGNQLRQARQPASDHRPILELRAAAHLRTAGELPRPGGGPGVDRVAGDGVHAAGGGGARAAAHPVPAARLHRHLLRGGLPGVAGLSPPRLHRRLPVQGHADGVHGRRRHHRVAAAAQGPPRHRPLHHAHGLHRRHGLRRQAAQGVGVADHRHGPRLPRRPPRHAADQCSEPEAFLGVSSCSPDMRDRLHHHLLLLQRPRHQHHRRSPQGSEPSVREHARLQRLLRRPIDQDRAHDRHPLPHRGDRCGADVRVDQQLPGGREQGDDGDRGDEHGGLLRLLLRHHRLLLPLRRQLQRRLQNRGVEHRHGCRRAGHAALPHAALPLHSQRDPLRHHHHGRGRAHRLPWRRQAVEGGQAGLHGLPRRLPRRPPRVCPGRARRRRGHLALQDPAAGDPAQHRGEGGRARDAELPEPGAVQGGSARAAVPRRRRRVGHLLRQLHVPGGEDHAVSQGGGGARRQGQPLLRPLRRPRHVRCVGDRHEWAGRAGGAEESAGQEEHRAGSGEPGGIGDGEDVQLGGGGDVRVGPHLLQRRRGRRGGAVQGGAAMTRP